MSDVEVARGGRLREVFEVAAAEVLELATSLRAAFLTLTYGLIAGGAGAFIVFVDNKTGGQVTQLAVKAAELQPEQRQALVEKLGEGGVVSERFVELLVGGSLPPLVFGVLLASTFAIPGLILLVGYNRISEDLHSRFSRYVLQRVHRSSYLFGKLLGQWLVAYLAIVLVHAALLAVGAAKASPMMGSALSAMPRIWLGFAFFVLAYVSYTVFLSTLISTPFWVLLLGTFGFLAIKILSLVLGQLDPALDKLWLGDWVFDLWALSPVALSVYVAYAAGFLGLAYVILERRDV